MLATLLHDKAVIEAYLRRRPALHLYELGDLDGFFWPHTCWYAGRDEEGIRSLALLYAGTGYPVLLALAEAPLEPMAELLGSLQPLLPWRFYSHLSPGLARVFEEHYACEPHGRFDKMVLARPEALEGVDTLEAFALGPADVTEVEAFYGEAYPGNWFDPRMLRTGCYFGLRRGGRLASVAGIHVYSPEYGVAALGNIATHPAWRGQGLGLQVTARLCRHLLRRVAVVGLNVASGNGTAIRLYRGLGFEKIAEYEEWALQRRLG